MFISYLPRLNGSPQPFPYEKAQLTRYLLTHRETLDKRSSPLWTPAYFSGNRRLIVDCLGVSALVFDLDHGPLGLKDPVREEDVLDATQRLRADGLEHLVVSSYSYMLPGKGPRVRIVVFLTKQVIPGVGGKRWKAFWRACVARWCPLADTAASDCVHAFYASSCPPAAPRVALHVPGRELDPDEILSTLSDSEISDPTVAETVEPFRTASRQDLQDTAAKWARQARSSPYKAAMLSTLRALVKGERLADDGAKERTIFKLCFALMEEIPHVTNETLADLFSPSLAIMGVDPAGYRADLLDKIERGRRNAMDRCLVTPREEAMYGRPIVQDPQTNIYFKQGGHYEGPFKRGVLREAFKERFHEEIARGQFRLEGLDGKPINDSAVIDRYGQTVTAIKYEIGRTEDEIQDRVLWLGCANRRVEAVWNDTCETFLRIICGAQDPVDTRGAKVLDDVKLWLAVAKLYPMEPLPALQLVGEAGVGKSTFAWAVARLWHDGPPLKATEAFSQFNARLKDCPFIFADEGLPSNARQGQLTFTQRFRELLTSTSLDVEAKGQMATTVKGAPRIWFAVNEAEDLATNEAYGAGTIRALADRYYRLPYMGPDMLKAVIALGDQGRAEIIQCMAGHIMWLASYAVKIEKRGRFWIEGDREEIVSELKTSGGLRDKILQLVASWIFEPSKQNQLGRPLASRVSADGIFLASNEIVDLWTTFFPTARDVPAIRSVGQALRGLAVSEARPGANAGLANRRLYVLDIGALRRWCVASGRATPEELEAQIKFVVLLREQQAQKAAEAARAN